jgi:hypothetical protein
MKTRTIVSLVMLLSLLLTAASCVTAPKTHDDYTALFRDEYPNPVVRVRSTALSQLTLCSVYDKSWEAEDPLIPQLWIVCADGKRFHSFEIEKAILHTGHEAKDEAGAMALLELYMMVNEDLTLIRNPEDEYFTSIIPRSEIVKIRKPSCERLGTALVVHCHALSSNERRVLFRNKPIVRTLEAITLRADASTFAHERRQVWSSAPGSDGE